jgi:hypothetical protein
MRIAFHSDQLCVRGTSVAMFDYAFFNQTLLKNQSVIIVPFTARNDVEAVKHFSNHFQIIYYRDKQVEDLESKLEENKCDVLYCIKYGKNDGIVSKKIRTVVHCVFDCSEPHGDVYAAVSKALADKFNISSFVPHMISIKEHLKECREETKDCLRTLLNIPANAVVFGRYGGMDTMNLDFCWRAIKFVVENYPNIYFIFCNTPQLVQHPQIIYLQKTASLQFKQAFIQACDAHLECGSLGHSFGLAIGEFNVFNKPIIAYNPALQPSFWNDSHIKILGTKGLYYSDERQFIHMLTTFDKHEQSLKDWNVYENTYSPHNVMEMFQNVFLQPNKQDQ